MIVEKSIGGLRHRAVDTSLRVVWRLEGDGVGGVGGRDWRRRRLVMVGPSVGDGL